MNLKKLAPRAMNAAVRARRNASRAIHALLVSYLGGAPHDRATRAVARVATAIRVPLGRRPVEAGETTLRSYAGRYYEAGEVSAELLDAGFRIVRDELLPYAHVVGLAPLRSGQ
jgi:hypothetical protein